jgi:Family of unknown function (DUF6510)
MQALDGNAIGGLLHDVFGAELTAATKVCGGCGDRGPLAEVVVYLRAPGTVARCRSCGQVLMVFVSVREVWSVNLSGLAALDP